MNYALNLFHGLVQGLVHEMLKQACPEEMPKSLDPESSSGPGSA